MSGHHAIAVPLDACSKRHESLTMRPDLNQRSEGNRMRRIRLTRLVSATAFMVATSAAAGVGGLVNLSSAHADPAWGTQAATSTPLVAMGSNTIEDLMNAYAGEEPTPGLEATNAFGLSAAQVQAATHFYTPLHDNVTATAGEGTENQIYSWDAISPFSGSVDCVNAKAGFPNLPRANGSGNGKTLMSDAVSGVGWGTTAATCNPTGGLYTASPAGEVDFTRSSSGPATPACVPVFTAPPTPCLVYVDFAHDAVPYAYYAPGVAGATPGNAANPLDHLTTTELNLIFKSTPTSGVQTITVGTSTVTLVPCMPQSGSGTGNFWAGKVSDAGGPPTVADSSAGAWDCGGTFASTSTVACPPPLATPCTLEENGAVSFKNFGDADLAPGNPFGLVSGTTAFIIPFSAGSFISQENGVALDRSSAAVQTTTSTTGIALGIPDGTAGNVPYTGTISGAPPQSLAPAGTAITGFEGSAYGRDLYLVTNDAKLNGPLAQRNLTFRGLFGFDGTNVTTALSNASNATTAGGAICQTGTATTVATSPPTVAGPAQSYLSLFGFLPPLTSTGAANCGAETTVTPVTGTGTS
jgi:hypothetical protein